MKNEKPVSPPKAPKIDTILSKHGYDRTDPWYWLNERKNPEVIKYLEDENAYTLKMMQHTEAFQDELFQEITSRIAEEDASVPYFKNGYFYYHRFESGKEHPIYCRKKGSLDAPEEIMINVNKLAKKHAYYTIGNWSVSPDNKWLAFAEDTLGRRIYSICFMDLDSGIILPQKIKNTSGSMAWASDNKTLFYVTRDESLRPSKIWRHQLNTNQDELVFDEENEAFNTFVYRCKSGKYIVAGSSSTLTDEYRLLPADQADGDFEVFQSRIRGLEYSIEHKDNKFLIRTNLLQKDFSLMWCPEAQTSKENWNEFAAAEPGVFLEDFEVLHDFVLMHERRKAREGFRVLPWDKPAESYEIAFDSEIFTLEIGKNPDPESNVFRYSYSSLITPVSKYDIELSNGERKLLKKEVVKGGYDESAYEEHRLWAPARDGAAIPISVVYRKDLIKSQGNPLLLYGYGSYGHPTDASFRSHRLSLLDRGFIWAIAHVRGGQELGRDWYDQGRLLNKKNSFTDFIDCAEYLIDQSYTTPGQLAALGGSAGGLLMGAVINERPDLFRAVIAAVPFVDVVTTMLDDNIPLTTGEYDEWGNPNEKEYFEYMLSYSPYDQVAVVDYPALLVTTGLHDSQVQYWEPAKWVAKMRDTGLGNKLLLLHTEMDFGHSGASGRFEKYKETALEYAFLIDQIKGLK